MTFDETEEKQKFILSTPGGHFFILDDTVDNEALFLIHKSGSQIQTDAQGNTKILGADGSFVFINSETGAVTLTAQSGAYVAVNENGISMSDPSGSNLTTISGDSIQNIAGGDFVVQSNSFGVTTGGVDIKDNVGAGLKITNGQVALGSPAGELVDLVVQIIDAFLNAPTLVGTGTGPSSPLTPPASVNLTLIKTLLESIKGSL